VCCVEAESTMASQVVPGKVEGDKYRSFLDDEAHTTHWRHGGPPIYDAVNKLFEQGRTKVCTIYICIYIYFLHYGLF
jgi:hypothetical protein